MSKSPHVVIVVQNLPVPKDRRVWREAKALAAHGYDVTVVSPKAPGDPSDAVLDGVRLRKFRPLPDTGSIANVIAEFAYSWLRIAAIVFGIARRQRIDIFQACNPPETFFPIALLLRPTGTRFVFDHHDLSPEMLDAKYETPRPLLRRALLTLEQLTMRTADHVVATNGSLRDVAIERGGVSPDRVTVVRNGPETDVMRRGPEVPALRRGRVHLACYVGVMGPQDGVEGLVRAIDVYVHKLGRDNVQFALLGSGPSLAAVRELVDELGLRDHVDLPGWLEDAELFSYLSTASVGLCPEPATPLNQSSTMIKALEYLAFELPVVSYDLKETRVSTGDAAVYVEPGDVVAFAEALADLIDEPALRAEMAALGRQRAEDTLAWAHQAKAYVALFEALTKRPGAADYRGDGIR